MSDAPAASAAQAAITGRSAWHQMRRFWAQPDPPEFTWRLLNYFGVARMLLAAAIIYYFAVRGGNGNLSFATRQQIYWIGLPYLVSAVLGFLWAWFSKKHFYIQLTVRLTIDLACLSAVFLILDNHRPGLAILFLLPILGVAVLGTVTAALFAAAIASLVILAAPLMSLWLLVPSDLSFLQAGFYGLTFMATALLMRMLAQRQIVQETIALEREFALHLQQAIHRLMVHDMQDGVMLARSDGTVLAINPAASALIGLGQSDNWQMSAAPELVITGQLRQQTHLRPLLDAMRRWLRKQDDAPRMLEIERPNLTVLTSPLGDTMEILAARVRLRVHFVLPTLNDSSEYMGVLTTRMPQLEQRTLANATAEQAEIRRQHTAQLPDSLRQALRDTVLIYLESWEKITEQTQQEKLAAMGRLVAGIAHEVRNPLAAISHASELLAEDMQHRQDLLAATGDTNTVMQNRMLKIIADNVQRLDRMVSDVLLLSRRPRTDSGPILLQGEISHIVEQWRSNAGLPAKSNLKMTASAGQTINANVVRVVTEDLPPARFDTDHLRQIIFNLLDNAQRYCRHLPGSIVLNVYALDDHHAELMVWNDGPEITPDVERSLFEPFFTSEANGTGLGLYLARELCYANQAHIRYAPAQRERLRNALTPLGLYGKDNLPIRAFLITMRLDRPN